MKFWNMFSAFDNLCVDWITVVGFNKNNSGPKTVETIDKDVLCITLKHLVHNVIYLMCAKRVIFLEISVSALNEYLASWDYVSHAISLLLQYEVSNQWMSYVTLNSETHAIAITSIQRYKRLLSVRKFHSSRARTYFTKISCLPINCTSMLTAVNLNSLFVSINSYIH